MACRWIKRLLSSTSRVLLAVMLLGAELSTAIYAGYDVTNTQLAVVLASVNALTVLLTFLLPELVTFKSKVKDQDIERGSLLRRTVSAPASSLSDETMDLECVTPDPSNAGEEDLDPDCVIHGVGELGTGPEGTRCWRQAQSYSSFDDES